MCVFNRISCGVHLNTAHMYTVIHRYFAVLLPTSILFLIPISREYRCISWQIFFLISSIFIIFVLKNIF